MFRQQNQLIGVFGVPDPSAALSALGHQPVWHDHALALSGAPVWTNKTGTVVVSGEVLLDNSRDLRSALRLPDAADGELLAELYLRHGPNLGLHALGMYAGAIWDTERRRLLLIRDGVGCRTLYYAIDGKACWFGARLAALRHSPVVSGEISLTALRDYLTYAYLPGEETMWKDVKEILPGTTLELPGGEIQTYWEPAETQCDEEGTLEEHAIRLRELLEEAVRARMPRTGPVSVFLSGGIDSSLVTALVARFAPADVHTYSVHFGEDYPNELVFSNLVAERCGTEHHVIEVTPRDVQDHLLDTMAALDDPIGDPLTVPNLLLGRAAAQRSDIVLNGEGGDPCFGGPKNQAMFLHEIYDAGGSVERAYLRSYQKCFADLPRLLKPEVKSALTNAESQEDVLRPFFRSDGIGSYLNRLMNVNVRFKGAGHILTKVNNLTTANGLLGQSPLFDRHIVDAAFATPACFKVSGVNEKVVLKLAVADLLPEEVIRRPKSGMMVPVQKWFKDELREFARGVLLPGKANRRWARRGDGAQALISAYIDMKVVDEWLSLREAPRGLGARLWLLLSLELWLRAQREPAASGRDRSQVHSDAPASEWHPNATGLSLRWR